MKKLTVNTRKDLLGFHAHVIVNNELSIVESINLRRDINNWVIDNKLAHSYNGSWEWTFKQDKDLVWFLLKWQ